MGVLARGIKEDERKKTGGMYDSIYYSSFGLLSLIITLIINHNVLSASKDADAQVKILYKRFLFSVLAYYVSDVLWGLFDHFKLMTLLNLDTAVYFMLMSVSVLLWVRYVVAYLGRKSAGSTMLLCIGWLIPVYTFVTLILNYIFPSWRLVYYFDENNGYQPGAVRHFTLALQLLMFLAISVYALIVALKTKGKSRLHHRTIGFSGIVMSVFIIAQTWFSLLPLYAIGCLITTCLIHAFIIEDERKARSLELGTARHKAYTDSLTGVKNPHAYAEAKAELDRRIENGDVEEFAAVVFDLNGLKIINDTEGHDAGDRYLESAAELICTRFKRSPVFRIGGDEFVAFLEGDDYRNREALLEDFNRQVEENQENGLVVVSSGLSDFVRGEDNDYNTVFERADNKMYERKRELKERLLTLK